VTVRLKEFNEKGFMLGEGQFVAFGDVATLKMQGYYGSKRTFERHLVLLAVAAAIVVVAYLLAAAIAHGA
jgi:hypothetical protein